MDRAVLENLLQQIKGCSFANLDAETEVFSGVKHVVTGKRVLLFTNQEGSGYEAMVKRRLQAAGKNPDNFLLGERWGTRVPNTPLIEHNGDTYLQVIELAEGQSRYLMNGKEYPPEKLGIKPKRHYGQGLSPTDEVKVKCYKLGNIVKISLMGETLSRSNGRSILSISA